MSEMCQEQKWRAFFPACIRFRLLAIVECRGSLVFGAGKVTHLQNFDPVWCGKIMKVRAVGSVAAVFSAIVIMLAYDRPGGWKIPGEAGSSLWGLIFLIVGPAATIAVYQSLHW